MGKKLQILIAGRSKPAIDDLAGHLAAESAYGVEKRHIQNGHADPLYGLSSLPDVVVLLLDGRGHSDLELMVGEQTPGGPPMIVLAENGDTHTMRLAMRAGARDFLCGSVAVEDLIETIDRIAVQLVDRESSTTRNLTVFVNAKGGSGATFAACNVAHLLASTANSSTALLSLDLQFGGASEYLDVKPRHGLMDVLDSVESLDEIALDAYMTQHASGLRLLAPEPENLINVPAKRAVQLGMLVKKMMSCYDQVIVDMPRRIDPHAVPVLEHASQIVLVLQQTLSHLHGASRMLEVLESYGITASRVLAVINRYDKNSPITVEDIDRSLKGTEVALIPSDFKTVAESINLGIPMQEHARGSSVTKALVALQKRLGGATEEVSSGLLSRAFSNILRKDKWA